MIRLLTLVARLHSPLAVLGCVLALPLAVSAQANPTAPLVAAAANLQVALGEIAQQYKTEAGRDVRLSYGSSVNIARQIRAGAPFQIFLSADEQTVLDLARDGLTRDEGALYAIGRLALFVPNASPLAADGSLDDLAAALAAGKVRRFAIANPELAPYGKAAVEVLRHKGLWDKLTGRLVLGDSISQAAQFASSGATEGGLVALSLALAPELARLGKFAAIPDAWHDPLRQRMVLTRQAGVAAEHFFTYLQGPAARATLARYGFSVPEAGR